MAAEEAEQTYLHCMCARFAWYAWMTVHLRDLDEFLRSLLYDQPPQQRLSTPDTHWLSTLHLVMRTAGRLRWSQLQNLLFLYPRAPVPAT